VNREDIQRGFGCSLLAPVEKISATVPAKTRLKSQLNRSKQREPRRQSTHLCFFSVTSASSCWKTRCDCPGQDVSEDAIKQEQAEETEKTFNAPVVFLCYLCFLLLKNSLRLSRPRRV